MSFYATDVTKYQTNTMLCQEICMECLWLKYYELT